MLAFAWIVLAILTVVFANPIPENVEDSSYLNIGTDPTYNPSDTVIIEASSDVPSNADTVTDSIIVSGSGPKCITDASVDGQVDDSIQKRSDVCPIHINDRPISQPARQQPAGDTRTKTKYPRECPNPEFPDYVACGGAVVVDYDFHSQVAAIVLNCVPGKSCE